MIRLANYFLNSFKPGFMYLSQYIGILTIYFGITLILENFLEWGIVYTFMAIFIIGFLIDSWAKNSILEMRIKEIVDEEENINKIVDNKNIINYSILNGMISRMENRLRKEGFYNNKFIGEGESATEEIKSIDKKIKKVIWQKFENYERHH